MSKALLSTYLVQWAKPDRILQWAYFQLGQICEIKTDNNTNSPYIDEAKNIT